MVKLLQLARTDVDGDIDRKRRIRSEIEVVMLDCNTIAVKQMLRLESSKSGEANFKIEKGSGDYMFESPE
jgi:hypothetical protein